MLLPRARGCSGHPLCCINARVQVSSFLHFLNIPTNNSIDEATLLKPDYPFIEHEPKKITLMHTATSDTMGYPAKCLRLLRYCVCSQIHTSSASQTYAEHS